MTLRMEWTGLGALGLFVCLNLAGCSGQSPALEQRPGQSSERIDPSIQVLGTLQDGGAPHIGCDRLCCRNIFLRPAHERSVVCLGLTDVDGQGQTVGAILEATPDFPEQVRAFQSWSGVPMERLAVFLTHAHIGHYSGLMYLGREALGAKGVPVWVMPKMRTFLTENGPWNQLVTLGNIQLQELTADVPVALGSSVRLTPLRVPHRDEFSETVGYKIQGPHRAALFIPDINKWDEWDRSLAEELAAVDRAYLDATFFDAAEVGHRDMSEIPHPFMVETLQLLESLPASERAKVHFIHFNHTNPCLDATSPAYQRVIEQGFNIAEVGDMFEL